MRVTWCKARKSMISQMFVNYCEVPFKEKKLVDTVVTVTVCSLNVAQRLHS